MALVPGQLKHIARRFGRSPMFTAITVLTIAIGIGANTAIFSVVDSVLIRPLPYPDAERLVAIWETAPGIGFREINASPATYFTFREEGRVFEDSGVWTGDSVSITGLSEPEQVAGLAVTDGVLPVLGVRPARGRWFTRKDDTPGSPETIMLSWGYWQRRFGGDDSAIGRRLMADGKPREIIGVMPRGFHFMTDAEVIVPLRFNRGEVFIGNFSYQAVARLKPGVTVAQANADVARMLPIMGRKFPPAPGMSAKLLEQARIGPNVRPLKNDVVGDAGNILWVLMATVGIVLFIACANVANLLLVRTEGRQQELAVRAALGAGRGRIARELLAESVTLGMAGGAAGLLLANGGLQLLKLLSPANLPRIEEIGIDGRVVVFAAAVSLVSGVLFGLLPVYKYAGARVAAAIREGGRTGTEGRERHRARGALVVVQVAMALVLLVGSGLMMRTLTAMRSVQPGFTNPDQVLTLRVSIPGAQVPDDNRAAQMEYDILQKIAAIPGVTSVGFANAITMDGNNSNDPIFVEGRNYRDGEMPPIRRYKWVSPGFFRAMGNPILAGRDFTWVDAFEKRPVIMISENLARELWGSPGAAIGKRVREHPSGVWREVIGVTGNERDNGVDQKAPTVAYWPFMVGDFWQIKVRLERYPAFAIRTSRAGSATLRKEVQQAIWSVNPDLPLAYVQTLREIYDRSMARTSFTLVMLGIASAMALLLGVVGLYGVISYSVEQRTREIGIRMALGAEQSGVQAMFVRHGLVLTGIGLVCGIAAAISLTRLMRGLLFEVSPVDPLTYAGVSIVLALAALFATWLPARRATAIDPVDALRNNA